MPVLCNGKGSSKTVASSTVSALWGLTLWVGTFVVEAGGLGACPGGGQEGA